MKNKIIGVLLCLIGVFLMIYSYFDENAFPTKETLYQQLQNEKLDVVLEELKEYTQEDVINAWGNPDSMLSGLYGDIYKVNEEEVIIIYYSSYDGNINDIKLTMIQHH